MQPLIGKYILPWFGSSPSVWTTSLLFFQIVLLAGYAYAHLIASRLSARRQVYLHLAVLASVMLLLPITPSAAWKPSPGDEPTRRILLLLTASIGGPYLLLASTSPLLQDWFARLHPRTSPYPLYAVSNAGSLAALLTYPFFIERFLRLQMQMWEWSIAFVGFAILAGLCGWQLRTAERQPGGAVHKAGAAGAPGDGNAAAPSWPRLLVWLALPTCGSVMLLATTNQLSQNVPSVPFLFILPLSLYLLSFIICFDRERWYHRPFFTVLLPLAVAGGCVALSAEKTLGVKLQIVLFSTALFACCMSCHGELARLKPAPKHLTLFYLLVALGGALGGVFVAVLAPVLFDGYWEYEIGLIASFGLVMVLVGLDLRRAGRADARPAGTGSPTQAGSPTRQRGERYRRVARHRKQVPAHGPRQARPPRWLGAATLAFAAVGASVLTGLFAWNRVVERHRLLAQERSFYGVIEVREVLASYPRLHKYSISHGTTQHGLQYRLPERQAWPTTYYGRSAGVGIAITQHPARADLERPFRIGVIGLGAGTLAAYANDATHRQNHRKQADDHLVFYEINPDVIDLADRYFSFVGDARARGAEVEILQGDARIVLEDQLRRGEAQQFDVLVADAFTGDAIPMHLLAKESFDLYWRHLKPDGILAVHVSSRYLNLLPVVQTLAELSGKESVLVASPGDSYGASDNRWMLVTSNAEFLASPRVQEARSPLGPQPRVLWTDDYSSLFEVIR